MSEFVTVARPYAKAAFDFAVEHQSVARWPDMLAFAAEVTKNEQMALERYTEGKVSIVEMIEAQNYRQISQTNRLKK